VSRSGDPEIAAGGYGEGTMTARSGGWTGGAWSALWRAVTDLASLRQRRAIKNLTRRRSWIEQARQAPTVQQLMERKAALASRPDDGR